MSYDFCALATCVIKDTVCWAKKCTRENFKIFQGFSGILKVIRGDNIASFTTYNKQHVLRVLPSCSPSQSSDPLQARGRMGGEERRRGVASRSNIDRRPTWQASSASISLYLLYERHCRLQHRGKEGEIDQVHYVVRQTTGRPYERSADLGPSRMWDVSFWMITMCSVARYILIWQNDGQYS